ncbi:MAG: hypothetical protein ACOYZ7_02185 [Chloroflexota bacterium]
MPQKQAPIQEIDTSHYWLQMLAVYDVRYFVLHPHDDRDMLELLRSQPEWTEDFQDEEMALFVRVAA